LGGLVYGLIESSRLSFVGWPVGGAIIVGLVALVAFVFVEARVHSPMLPLVLFRSKNFAGANLLTLFLYASLGGLMFFFPMDLIQIQHYTATEAGATFLPFIAIMFGLSRWAGGLVARYGSRPPLTVGPLVAACGIALFAVVPQSGSYWVTFFPAVVVMGLGMTISVAPLTTTVMNAVPESESGLASGINNAVSRLASLLAVAAFGVVLVTVFNRSLDHHLSQLSLSPNLRAQVDAVRPLLAAAHNPDPIVQHAITESFLSGYRAVIWIATGLAALSAIIAWLLIESGAPTSAEKV